jgi:filamentous hemagglutinin family protein
MEISLMRNAPLFDRPALQQIASPRWSGVSRAAMAIMLAAPLIAHSGAARAGSMATAGFVGTPTVVSGSASFVNTGTTQTVTIPVSSPQTIINWVPTDTATSASPINFLPNGSTESYVGTASPGASYTVLNRILPTDPTRVVGFNGTVVSTPNTNVWFYSPAGILIGATASFDVGSLVLTTADPTSNGNGGFFTYSGGTTRFSVAGTAGSQSAITIMAGAQLNAIDQGRSDYIIAIAPQINNGGTISVAGSAALVAAESATFAIDSQGLFNITVDAGTTVANNTFISTGSVGGPDSVANGAASLRRVYMVAVPKNNAITMAISAGGPNGIGFATAGAAAMDGNEIVLSAGENIADTGTGNPTIGVSAGTGLAALSVGGGNYTSNSYAVSTGTATITDLANGFSFASNLTVLAPNTLLNLTAGTTTVGGDFNLNSDTSGFPGPDQALVTISGASLSVGTNAKALGVNGTMNVSANDTLGGIGGTAQLTVTGGSLNVAGNLTVSGNGNFSGVGATNSGGSPTLGGTTLVQAAQGGSINVAGQILVSASADASNADNLYTGTPGQDVAIFGDAGSAQIIATGANSLISAGSGVSVLANATGGTDFNIGYGGTAQGGTAHIGADTGGALQIGANGLLVANAGAVAGAAYSGVNSGGSATGGSASLTANAGTITLTAPANIAITAGAVAGSGSFGNNGTGGSGGSATGGSAIISATGANGAISSSGNNGSSLILDASATGGTGYFAVGGDAKAGTAAIDVLGAGNSVSLAGFADVALLAGARGGQGNGFGGGRATGGMARLKVVGGTFSTDGQLVMNAAASGGVDSSGAGGNAIGGTVLIGATKSASLTIANGSSLSAAAFGGGAYNGTGGNAVSGNILVTTDASSNFALDQNSAGIFVDASGVGGNGNSSGSGGSSTGTTRAAGGGLFDLGRDFVLGGPLSLVGNSTLVIKTAGIINIAGPIAAPGDGAYLQLWADDLGTGKGTVTVANGAINLSGKGATVDIDYNPASLGTPTNYIPGVAAGLLTAYQLVDNVDQLQTVGSYLGQNFALGKNIDASATQGWNNGAGFVPIGSLATPFTGNFDGLNHTITNLYINAPFTDYVGLFGAVNANGITIRNVGLNNPMIVGLDYTGGLIGSISCAGNCGPTSVTNDYVSLGNVTGNAYVGGLIGLSNGSNIVVSNDHAGTAIFGGGNAGGLVGSNNLGTVTDVFATGAVSSPGLVGGLVGVNTGTISQAYATGMVTAQGGGASIGGLVGLNYGIISQAYATGAVNAGANANTVGGLVGENNPNGGNNGSISESYASGPVSASGTFAIGGLVGRNDNGGKISNSYWDSYSTGESSGIGTDQGSTTNFNFVTSDPAQINAANYAFNPNTYGNFVPGDFVFDNFNTRPLGAWEVPVARFGVAPLSSAHQIQLIDFNLGGNYTLTQNIDLGGTAGTRDIWGPGGFQPLGIIVADPPFTGIFNGAGHVLSGLTMSPGFGYPNAGLIQDNQGTISDLGLYNFNITATNASHVGAIAGTNQGVIFDSFAVGTITLTQYSAQYGVAGGLVGLNSGAGQATTAGTISQSYATVAVTGGAAGGLVGDNEGAITQTYANGAVNGTQTTGGLVGESLSPSGATVTNSYWDSQLTGQSAGCGSIGYSGACSGVTALTTAQSLQSSSYVGFAIDTVGGQALPWRQYEGSTTPLLKAFLRPLTIAVQDLTTTYNAADQAPGISTIAADPALLFGSAQVSGSGRNVGTYSIDYAGGLYSNQIGYDIIPAGSSGILTITPAQLQLAAVSDTKTYDATTGSAGQPTVSGLQGQDGVNNLTQSFDSPNAGSRTLTVDGGYSIADGNGGNNYTVTQFDADGSISPAALTLAAVGSTKIYDATTGSASVPNAFGLQGNDSVNNLTQSFDSANAGGRSLSVDAGYSIADGNGGNNYTVSLSNAEGSITPAALMLAAVSDSRGYNATTGSAGLPTAIGLQGKDTVASLSQSFDSANAGSRTLSVDGGYSIADGNGGNNYAVTLQSAQGTLTAAALTLAAVSDTRVYDATTNSAGVVKISGLFGTDSVTSLTQSFASRNVLGTNASTLTVGSGYVVSDGNGGNNYTVTRQTARGTITPAALTLAAVRDTRIYDATTRSAGAPQASGLFGNDTVGNLSQSFTSSNVMGAGASKLVVNQGYSVSDGNNGNNYTITLQSAAGTINPALLTLAAVSDTRRYDATINSVGAPQALGLFGNDSVSSLTQAFASANVMGTNGSTLVVRQGYVIADGNSGNNYTVALRSASGTITPAPLTLAAVNDSRVYNATAVSAAHPAATGLFGSDQVTNFSQSFDSRNVGARTISVNAGYAVADGNGGNNYTVMLTGATGTISAAPLVLTARSQTRVYDSTTGSTRSVSVFGLYSTDQVTGLSQSFDSRNTGARTLSVNSGYVVSDGNGGQNYTVSLATAPGNITPAQLQLAAVTDTKVYDATTSSAGTPGASGLFGQDNVSSLSQSFTSPNAMGTNGSTLIVNQGYLINDGNGGNNYTITLRSAAGTITPAALMLTLGAVSDTKIYDATTTSSGQPTAMGLQASDSINNLSQSFTSPNVMGTNGSTLVVNPGYVIVDSNSGKNYAVTLQSAPGTITPAPLTLAAVSDIKVYDATTSSSGVPTATGLFGNDSVSRLLQSFTSRNVTGTNGSTLGVGSGYVVSDGNLGNLMGTNGSTLVVNPGYVVNDGNSGGNYAVSLQSAQGTITPAQILLGAVSDTRVYDATTSSSGLPTAAGFVGTDQVTNLSQSFDSRNVGERTLSVNSGYAVSDGNGGQNYTVSLLNATGSITPAQLQLAAAGDTKVYDASTNSAGQPNAIGLQSADGVNNLSQSFDSANAGERTLSVNGGYSIADGNGGNNYTVSLVAASGSITAAPLLVTYVANPANSTYGDQIAGLNGTYTAAGLQGSDTAAGVLLASALGTPPAATFTTPASSQSGVGRYAVNGSGLSGTSGNYTYSFAQASGNATALTIVPRAITIFADPESRQLGTANPPLLYMVTRTSTEPTTAPGLVNGDQLNGALATTATPASPMGAYPITIGTLAASPNYAVTYVGNSLNVLVPDRFIEQAIIAIDTALPGTDDVGDPNGNGSSNGDELRRRLLGEVVAATHGALLPTWLTPLIDERQVTRPAYIYDPVTINGNSTLWNPGAR